MAAKKKVNSKTKSLNIEKFLTGFRSEFHDFRGVMLKRFDSVDQRFDGVDQRLDGVDQRLDNADKRFDGIDKELSILTKVVISTDKQVQALNKDMQTLNKRVDVLTVKVDAHSADIIEWQQKTTVTLDALVSVNEQGLQIKNVEKRLTVVENDQAAMKLAIKDLKEI